ncbi:hypothetical protein FRC02_010292 [Tulasnella sp. 418]|nr:hypothetical protein FRC02_010292 [Tulasnella sp. 418]
MPALLSTLYLFESINQDYTQGSTIDGNWIILWLHSIGHSILVALAFAFVIHQLLLQLHSLELPSRQTIIHLVQSWIEALTPYFGAGNRVAAFQALIEHI